MTVGSPHETYPKRLPDRGGAPRLHQAPPADRTEAPAKGQGETAQRRRVPTAHGASVRPTPGPIGQPAHRKPSSSSVHSGKKFSV